MKFIRNKKAFTLIELLVVIVIIGILVLFGAPRFKGHTQRAELTRIQHDIKVMEQEVGTVLINKDDDFNEWENNIKDLNQLAQDNKLFEKEGPVVDPIDGPYKVIPEKYKDKINTKLKGTFYANSGGKAYYEHEKPLSGIPSEPEKESVYSDEEIDDLIENDFIPVATAEELNNVRSATLETYGKGTQWEGKYTGGLDKKYVQVANIDLSDYSKEEGWAPIGNGSSIFTGSFDGNGYNITGLTINRSTTDYVGLFGYTEGATIKNVALEDIDIKGKDNTGGLVGRAHGSSIENSYATGSVTGTGERTGGLVGRANTSSTVSNSYATGSVAGTERVGGLVGGVNIYTEITNSYATGKVTGIGNVGGLLGYADISSTITNSYATGEVIGRAFVGGLLGSARQSTITNSYATGAVTGEGRYIGVGGLVGWAYGSTTIEKSYATGKVTGGTSTGGLVGSAGTGTIKNSYATGSVESIDFTGGLVGSANASTEITNSYATGKVKGGGRTGGLVGEADNSTTNSYWDKETTEQSRSDGWAARGKTTEEMKMKDTYVDWDFDTIWQIDEGQSYPTLIEANPEQPGDNNDEDDNNPIGPREPIAIDLAEKLAKIGTSSEYPLSGDYILTANIDLSHIDNWTPIGNEDSRFTGSFDGNGYSITGLTINRSTRNDVGVGLFGYTKGATINNVGLIGNKVSGYSRVGVLVGWAEASTIENSYATATDKVSGAEHVGGLVGYASNSTTIDNSYATGYATGGEKVGGLVGWAQNNTKISNSYATGSASAGSATGGLVGEAVNSTIEKSYATGRIDGGSAIGGLVGRAYSSTISNSYWDKETTRQDYSDGGEGKSTDDMKNKDTYSGWDFVNVWKIDGNDYPKLR